MTLKFNITRAGFSLIELLLVIVIIAMLAAMISPATAAIRKRADTTACANNLRQIGVAVQLYVNDNENRYPKIETDPLKDAVYEDQEGVGGMLETLGKYGLTEDTLKCPADMQREQPAHGTYGLSYEWRPMVDGESRTAPSMVGRGGAMTVNPSRLRQVTDFFPVHSGRRNLLFADGHVRSF